MAIVNFILMLSINIAAFSKCFSEIVTIHILMKMTGQLDWYIYQLLVCQPTVPVSIIQAGKEWLTTLGALQQVSVSLS